MNQYIIREAFINDVVQISRVHIDSWKTAYKGLLPESILKKLTSEDAEQLWAKVLNTNLENVKVYVAQINDKIVGFCSVEKLKQKSLIHALYVLPEYQRLRIGSKLLLAAIDYFEAMDCQIVELGVLPKNPTINFYEKLHGENVGKKEIDIFGHKTTEQIIRWKNLKALKKSITELIGTNPIMKKI